MNKGETLKNLKPLNGRSKEEAWKIRSMGGIKAGVTKREKIRMSAIYADFLADKYDIELDGEIQKTTGAKRVNAVIKKIIEGGGPSAVSMLKELREGTEGQKVTVDASIRPAWPDELKGKPIG